ncbi:MAG: SPOR domain-containing protein, partial [Cyclobacteriaceae bacterium]
EPKQAKEEVVLADTLQSTNIIAKKQKAEKKPKKIRKPKKEKQPKLKKEKAPKLKNIKPAEDNKPQEKPQQQVEKEVVIQEPEVIEPKEEQKAPTPAQQEATNENFQATRIEVNDPSISKGFYVTVGVFAEEQNALEYKAKMKNLGFKDSDYIFSEVKNYNYVYVLQTKDLTEARIMWLELRSTPGFEETWVYTVEVK